MEHRRRAQRVTVEGLPGKMMAAAQVEIVNMSLGGVAFEADKHLHVGEEYTLKLELPQGVVTIPGVVVWCVLIEFEAGPAGERAPRYSAGMRLKGVLTEEAEGLLAFIDQHKLVDDHRLKGLRILVDGKASLAVPHAFTVRIISLAGMLVSAAYPLSVGEVLPMEVPLPGEPPLRFSGRVVSCDAALDAALRHYDIGVEFADMAAAEREHLVRFVESLATGRADRTP